MTLMRGLNVNQIILLCLFLWAFMDGTIKTSSNYGDMALLNSVIRQESLTEDVMLAS